MRKLLVIVFSSIFFCSFAEDVELRNLGKHTGDRLETPVDAGALLCPRDSNRTGRRGL